MVDLIPSPRTRSGVRYVYPHRSGKWRGAFRLNGKWVSAPGLHTTKAEAFTAAKLLLTTLRDTESCTPKR